MPQVAGKRKCLKFPILLFPVACSLGLPACQRYAPVERHFLRVPAAYAADLSGIDRGKWLKRTRRLPGAQNEARTGGYLALPPESLPPGTVAPPGEVKFFPAREGGRQGMVALHWLPSLPSLRPGEGSRLFLLKTDGGRYVTQPLTRWLPPPLPGHRYSLSAEPGAIVTYHRGAGGAASAWRKAAVLRWRNGQWAVE